MKFSVVSTKVGFKVNPSLLCNGNTIPFANGKAKFLRFLNDLGFSSGLLDFLSVTISPDFLLVLQYGTWK